MIIPFILGTIAVLSVYIGFLKFKESKEEPDEVPHEEVFPDNDPVKIVYREKYGLHGKGQRIMQEFWSHQLNKIRKEQL